MHFTASALPSPGAKNPSYAIEMKDGVESLHNAFPEAADVSKICT